MLMSNSPSAFSDTLMRACLRDTPGSLMRRSASVPRPMVNPGGISGWRTPFTSSTSGARRIIVDDAAPPFSATVATEALVTSKRPVGSESSSTYSMWMGPSKTYPRAEACSRRSGTISAFRVRE